MTANGGARPTAGAGHSSSAGIARELWQATIRLRGAIEPSDYKRYVLPIIFLRFLSATRERSTGDAGRSVPGPIALPAAHWGAISGTLPETDIRVVLDEALEAVGEMYPELQSLLPRSYAASNLDREAVAMLVALFSQDVFGADPAAVDLLGYVYEYFIGAFADSEGKRGGEYFTPGSLARALVAMVEPEVGTVLDPCCGSGGLFLEAERFTGRSGRLSFHGQESKDSVYRLCQMNLILHGLTADIRLGNSYWDDQHASLQADYVLANPPFNDGAKGTEGWGAQRMLEADPRLEVGGERFPLDPRNANSMWMLHVLSHLKDGGTAGFVMATGELSSNRMQRLVVRRALVELGYLDAIVQLPGQLFANTQVPCSFWLLSKNRGGERGFRRRRGEVLFIDARRLGAFVPGSRGQKALSDTEIERIAGAYRTFRREDPPLAVPEFCRVATVDEIRKQGYALNPGRYVPSDAAAPDEEPFEARFPRLVERLDALVAEGDALQQEIVDQLRAMIHR